MRGDNTLELNQATMILAIQTYLNEHVFQKDCIVTKIGQRSSAGTVDQFTVELADEKPST